MVTWKSHFLKLGRLTLVNLVVGVVPTHMMACLTVPFGAVKEIERIRNFLLGHNNNNRKFYYLSWSTMNLSLHSGGLGIRDLQVFNYRMWRKRAWKVLLTNDQAKHDLSPWCFHMKRKYFPNTNLILARAKPHHSKG